MSLPMGRGSMRIRSCGLVKKRGDTRRAVKESCTEEKAMGVRFIGILLSCDSTAEQHNRDEFRQI